MLEWLRNEVIGSGAEITTPFGQRRITYADYVASGRPLSYIERTLQERVMPSYANTHTEDSFTGARTTHYAHEAAEYIKGCLGADDRYKIIFTGTGSTAAIKRLQEILGLSVPSPLRARVLEVTRPEERPVVFVGPYEHHSNEVSWRETIAEVVEIPLCDKGLIDLDALHAALTDKKYANRPKIGSFSAASNVTGIISDTRSIARLLHAQGAFACFDFAASAPYVKIDLRPGKPDGYDAVFISPHKFVGGPGSPGVLVFNQAMYTLETPSTAGGGTVTYVSSSEHHFVTDIEAREDAGTPAILQKMRAALAFWIKEQVGTELIEQREREFSTRALERLGQNPKLEILGNLTAKRLAVVSFLVRSDATSGGRYLHPRFVVRLLNDLFGIQSRGGCACAGPYGHQLLHINDDLSQRYMNTIQAGFEGIKPGWTRLNFNYFISDEEFEFLICALEFVADHGAKFVPLYDLDWHSGAWKHASDKPHPSLFQSLEFRDPVSSSVEKVPFQAYLEHARQLAEDLPEPSERPIPPDVSQQVSEELVFFRR
jgi:selenocysteine lyase/cysteine desulfurase